MDWVALAMLPRENGCMSKYSRGKQGEKKVSSILEAITEEHYLLNDVTLLNASSMMSHQVDHILIHPHSLFVIETKNYFGKILVDEASGQWKKDIRGRITRISNPLLQNKSHAITLRKILKSKYKPVPVVVFTQNNAPYLADENVINLDDLLLFIDSYPYQRKYTRKELAEIKGLIESNLADISLSEHLENIKTMKMVKKEREAEMTYAIEQGLCPCCDHKITISGYSYRCSKCGYHFEL